MDKFNQIKNKLMDRYFDEEHPEVIQNDNVLEKDSGAEIMEEMVENKPELEVKNEVFVPKTPSIVSEGTEINGSIREGYDLEVRGKIIGDVIIQGQLVVESGEIIGNIRAESVVLNHSKVNGNIECETTIDAQNQSYIMGQLVAKGIILDSHCKGNIYASDILRLLSQATVEGDVETKKIVVGEGALIDGFVKMFQAK